MARKKFPEYADELQRTEGSDPLTSGWALGGRCTEEGEKESETVLTVIRRVWGTSGGRQRDTRVEKTVKWSIGARKKEQGV